MEHPLLMALLLLVLVAGSGCQLPSFLLPVTPLAAAGNPPVPAQTGLPPEMEFSLTFQILDAAGKPLPNALVEVRERRLCKASTPCEQPLVFSGQADAGGWAGPVKLTGPYEDAQVLLTLRHRVYVNTAEAAGLEETTPNAYTVYVGSMSPAGASGASQPATEEERARLERERQEAEELRRQAERAQQFPFEGKGSYEDQRFKLVVGEGFTTSDGGFVIALDLVGEDGKTADSRLFHEGEDQGLFVGSDGNQILRTPFLVEKIYKQVSPGGAEIYSASIR